MSHVSWFDSELTATSWFEPELNKEAWFDSELIDLITGGIPTNYLKTLTGSIVMIAPLVRRTTKATPLTGSITASSTTSTMLLFTKILSGSLTVSGVISKRISKFLLGVSTGVGGVLKRTTKTMSGSSSLTGSVRKGIRKALQAVINPSATFVSIYSTSRSVGGLLQAFSSLIGNLLVPEVPQEPTSTPNHMRRFQGRR